MVEQIQARGRGRNFGPKLMWRPLELAALDLLGSAGEKSGRVVIKNRKESGGQESAILLVIGIRNLEAKRLALAALVAARESQELREPADIEAELEASG